MIGFDIQWRGKKLDEENGEWIYGSLYDDGGELYILPPYPGSAIDYEDYQINPNTIGIWIGRKDKYGYPIYTGDLLKDEHGKIWKVCMYRDQLQIAVIKEGDGITRLSFGFSFEECVVLETIYD